jgi:hypothetical protein
MESSQDGGDEAPAHYSTGRLTRVQADVVNAWRTRLLEDRPLPGERKRSPELRFLGLDDRPAASCSDVIAAAVAELLEQAPPAELEIARYAFAARRAHRAAGERDSGDAPRFPPVSFYLPGALTDQWEELRTSAFQTVSQIHTRLEIEAAQRFPEPAKGREREAWKRQGLAEAGCPPRVYVIPAGTLARMAIDRCGGAARPTASPRRPSSTPPTCTTSRTGPAVT